MDLHKVKINFGRRHCGGQSITSLSALTPPEPIIWVKVFIFIFFVFFFFLVKVFKICFNLDHYIDIFFSFHSIFSQALSTYSSLIVGSLGASGTLVVEEFAATLALTAVAVHTQQSLLSDGPHPSHTHLELVILPPSCISSRKTFWTASASFRSSSLESPTLSLASFCLFLRSRSLFLKLGSLRLLQSK